jgi:hypothetical protein
MDVNIEDDTTPQQNVSDVISPTGVSDSFADLNIRTPTNMSQIYSDNPSDVNHIGGGGDAPPPDNPSNDNPIGGDNKDLYLIELTSMLDYFQAHVDMYTTVINFYKNTHNKAMTDAYKKDMQRALPPKPNIKQPSTTEKKKDLLQMHGETLLSKLKTLLVNTKNQKEVPSFDAKVKDVDKVKNIIIQGEKSIDFKQKCVIKEAVTLGSWFNHLAMLLRGEFNAFINDNIKYGARWVHRLRSLSKVFCKYKKLQNLSLTISQAARIAPRVEKAIGQLSLIEELQFWSE